MRHEDLLDTIRRLLALGNSPNEHEAKLALAKAAELIARHNITVEECTEPVAGEWVEEVAYSAGRMAPAVMDICAIVREFFFVRIIGERQFKARTTLILFFGEPHNVLVARFVFGFLRATFYRLARERRVPRSRQTDYFRGMTYGFADQLRAAQRSARERQALVAAQGKLEAALAAHRPDLGPEKPHLMGAREDSADFWLGMADGQDIRLPTALAQREPRNSIPREQPLLACDQASRRS